LVEDLRRGRIHSTWYAIVTSELEKRGMVEEVDNTGGHFLSEKRRRAVEFSQYCFHTHLNVPTGSSADQIKRRRPFGIFPFLVSFSPNKTRHIFAFLCAVWRFIDDRACLNYPDVCERCDMENSSFHVLFVCPDFWDVREKFLDEAGVAFTLDSLATNDHDAQAAICDLGHRLFAEIAHRCRALPTMSREGQDADYSSASNDLSA
jgi:hypothetical protein